VGTDRNPRYIPTLDGWRAIAILGVILSHSFASTYWTRHGALGVNLFFAISGFLITSRLLGEQAMAGAISLKQFYIRRAFRILPPALFYLAIMGVLALTGVIYSSGIDFLGCLLFVRNYWGADAHQGWYTGHFWSLAVEEQFYLFWPALLVFAGVRKSKWIAPTLAIAFSVWRSLDLRNGWVASLLQDETLRNKPLRSDYRMDALLWGCTLALIAAHVDLRRFVPRRFASLMAVGLVAATVAFNVAQPQSYMVAESLLLPLLLMVTVSQPGSWLGRALEWKPVRWLGHLSYSLYLWQQPFVSQYHHGVLQRFPLNCALALACACASYHLVERPMVRLGHRVARPTSKRLIPPRAMAAAR
jgi:peptidoglycan/LPS O-acetylase OafA/YrhL